MPPHDAFNRRARDTSEQAQNRPMTNPEAD
jgi:hypothetical protein